jgi:hypothetical protein
MCVDNSEMHLKETDGQGLHWINVAQVWVKWRPLVNIVVNFRIP